MHLLVTRRTIPLDRTDHYGWLWEAVRVAALGAGLRAWRFRAADRDDRYLEFIEAPSAAALEAPAVDAARVALRESFAATEESLWLEQTLPDTETRGE
ncbi:MAG: hypothetical protein ACRELD_10565 [Longimicrobiales bacterium]